jgi:hypothetical protein
VATVAVSFAFVGDYAVPTWVIPGGVTTIALQLEGT